MIRYVTLFAALVLTTSAFAQQEQQQARPGDAQVNVFVEEMAQSLSQEADAYMDRLSFPVEVSVVTGDGEVLSGSFTEDEYRLLSHLPGEAIRLHSAQHALIREAQRMSEQRAEAQMEEGDEEEQMVVEEELALMPRQRIIEEAEVRTMDTRVEYLNDNVVFARTTISVGPETQQPQARAEEMEGMEGMEGEDRAVEEEERALRPETRSAELDLGLLLVREEGEWKVKNIITSEARMSER